MEIFKRIPQFDMYKAGSEGSVFSTYTNIIMRQYKNPFGYLRIKLYKDRKYYNRYVHRLVASAFLDDYSEDLQVNHINGIKSDNRVLNLEMMTRHQNVQHAYYNLGDSKRASPLSKSEIRAAKI